MKPKVIYSTAISTLVLIVLVFLAYFSWANYQNSTHIKKLGLYNLPTEFTNTLLSKKEIGLLHYWIQSRLDPILAEPAMDTDKYQKSVTLLESSLETFRPYYSEEEFDVIKTKLFPLDFLKELPILESYRREFIDTPNLGNAIAYHNQLIEVLNIYRESAESLATVFESFPNDTTLAYISGYTNYPHIAKTLGRLTSQVDLAISSENRRYACMNKYAENCSDLGHIFDSEKPEMNLTPINNSVIPDEVQNYAKLYEKYFSSEGEDGKALLLILQNTSDCYLYDGPVASRIWWFDSEIPETYPIIRSAIVNDVFLVFNQEMIELKKAERLDYEINEARLSTGMDFDFQDVSPYTCIDFEKDFAQIRTTYYIYNKLKQDPLIIDAIPNDDKSGKLLELGLRITESDQHLNVSDVSAFMRELESLLQQNGEARLTNDFGMNTIEKLEDLRLIWITQNAYPERSLNLLTELTYNLQSYILPYNKISLPDLFSSRSYMSYTFQTANHTLLNAPFSFLEEKRPTPLKESHMHSYKYELSSYMTFTMLEDALKKFATAVKIYKERTYAKHLQLLSNDLKTLE